MPPCRDALTRTDTAVKSAELGQLSPAEPQARIRAEVVPSVAKSVAKSNSALRHGGEGEGASTAVVLPKIHTPPLLPSPPKLPMLDACCDSQAGDFAPHALAFTRSSASTSLLLPLSDSSSLGVTLESASTVPRVLRDTPAPSKLLLDVAEHACPVCLRSLDVAAPPGARKTLCISIFRAARDGASSAGGALVVDVAWLLRNGELRRRQKRGGSANRSRGPQSLAKYCDSVLLQPRLQGVERRGDGGPVAGQSRLHADMASLGDSMRLSTIDPTSPACSDPARTSSDSAFVETFPVKMLRWKSSGRPTPRDKPSSRASNVSSSSTSNYPDLNAIHIASCLNLIRWTATTSAVEHVATNSPNLMILSADYFIANPSHSITAQNIVTIAAGCPLLVAIDLSGGEDRVTDEVVQALLHHCPAILELNLSDTAVTINTIQALKSYRPLTLLALGEYLRDSVPEEVRLFETVDTEIALGELLSVCGSLLTRLQICKPGWRMGFDLAILLADSIKKLRALYLVGNNSARCISWLTHRLPELRHLEIEDHDAEDLRAAVPGRVLLHVPYASEQFNAHGKYWDRLAGILPP
ncbi:hypothetical protein BDK51DRAFT_39653 [Blyttiomyces helicus]|uniref:Uncharacterized protein n=1 Tax=Blyttiomyces helicus TaxID=388810 RepID=A0A4P9WHE7_9FUNG|nr:hypothetical protein BDK51DRAFT_39653 [Blyttiomyces helicus]|eukprot:RKO91273.1 hypothetical protein BDK51DRAFT_39653 [Blyttiomyces helicus]